MRLPIPLLAACAWLAASAAWAHGEAPHAAAAPLVREQKAWGIASDAQGARTIALRMGDDMRFRPDRITVREGETIRFVAANRGQLLHEMVLGTPEDLRQHAELMKKHPGMEHDEPHMTHVKAGAKGEILWNFNRPGTFQFACLLPGHFEAGMLGTIVVTPRGKQP